MYVKGKKITNTVEMAKNTAEYIVARLVDLGITDCFVIPGDYSFSLDHALVGNKNLKYIGCANELNASYAADGYARERGAAILSTTYAVGELSAINGVMGAKAENNVIFHLVGTPPTTSQLGHKQVHHSLGDGVFDNFFALSAATACVSAIITPDNAVMEMDRIIHEAFKKRQPAYIALAFDHGLMPLTSKPAHNKTVANYVSQAKQLDLAISLIVQKITEAKKIVALPSIKLARFGVTDLALKVIEKLGVPFAIMPHDKSVICEHHSQYLGYYCGELSDKNVAKIMSQADLILDLGQMFWSDFNTGAFSAHLDLGKFLTLAPSFVSYQGTIINEVWLEELLEQLIEQLPHKEDFTSWHTPVNKVIGKPTEKITLESFYTRLLNFLQPHDICVVETGSTSLHFPSLPLPQKVTYHNQTLWGSIGWGTPATLGVALASRDKRVIFVTGEGSHQLTINELGTMGRYGIKPIIFCINNAGYTVERGLEINPDWEYDDLAEWQYAKLPEAMGCKNWLSCKVTTNIELETALHQAHEAEGGVYIELVVSKYDYNKTLNFYNEQIHAMYGI